MASGEIACLSGVELLSSYRRKTLSPVEAIEAVLDQINQNNGIVNAYCHIDAEGALAAARQSEARWMAASPRGLVDGIPIGIKDNILAAGMPARFGSKLTSAEPAGYDAPAVARLREHGAILIGKTAMPEFGWKPVTDSPLTGVTRNPWDTRKTPGGSSGGAAAAAILGMGPIQIGTDGGGSIRIPAAFTGCYGIKPTRPRVPVWPVSALGTLGHVGPLTRSVADAALALTVIAATDPRDVYSWPSPPPDFRPSLSNGVRGLRIAYSPGLGYAKRIDPEVKAAVSSAVRIFEDLGAHVEEADPDVGGDPVATWATLWWASAATILRAYGDRVQSEAEPDLILRAARGLKTTAVAYIDAQLERAEISAAFAGFFEKCDLLLTPTVPLPALTPVTLCRQMAVGARSGPIGPLLLSLQSHPTTGRVHSLRDHRGWASNRSANHWCDGSRCSRLRASHAFEAVKPLPTLRQPRTH